MISIVRVPRVDRIPHLCYHGISVNQLLHGGILFMAKEHSLWNAFTVVSIIDAFWDFVPCSSDANQRFGARIVSNSAEIHIGCAHRSKGHECQF
jgi:hypothetical protein